MIEHEQGSILSVTAGAIVHGCNAQMKMGSGVAAQLRAKYPSIYQDYCNHLLSTHKNVALGTVVYSWFGDLCICNAITQEFYGRDGAKYVSYDAIDLALQNISALFSEPEDYIYVPYLLGAGLGGGDKNIILAIFNKHFEYSKNTLVFMHYNG